MRLSLGMMVDGNSRFAFVESLDALGLTPSDLSDGKARAEVIAAYLERLKEVYVRNARWCIELGEELLSRVEDSDYAVFVYNAANRARGHFDSIDNAISRVGSDLVARLGEFGPVCLLGPSDEKRQWMRLFPNLSELSASYEGNRSVILTGYQHGAAEDARTRFVRPIDYFIRSTQMRFSGMYLSALSNTQFLMLSHLPCRYRASEIVDTLLEEAELDEEHDDLNVYSSGVYEEWVEHCAAEPALFLSSNARPPRVKRFSNNNGSAIKAV